MTVEKKKIGNKYQKTHMEDRIELAEAYRAKNQLIVDREIEKQKEEELKKAQEEAKSSSQN